MGLVSQVVHELPPQIIFQETTNSFTPCSDRERHVRDLVRRGLVVKANRLADCGEMAHVYKCENCGAKAKKTFRCGLRSCPGCAPKNFDRLFAKYVPLEEVIPRELKCRRGWGWRGVDFAFRHDGRMPTNEEIRRCEKVILRVMERALRHLKFRVPLPGKTSLRYVKPWGYIRCSEFGFDNTNLHFHLAYFGPWLDQAKLSQIFLRETGGRSYRVWVEKGDFRSVLAHALKYTKKLCRSTPEGRAELEAALHGTRRVQSVGLFLGLKLPKYVAGNPRCPVCKGYTKRVSEQLVSVRCLGNLPEVVYPNSLCEVALALYAPTRGSP